MSRNWRNILIDWSIGQVIILSTPSIRLSTPYFTPFALIARERCNKELVKNQLSREDLVQSGIKLDTFLFMGGGRGPKY